VDSGAAYRGRQPIPHLDHGNSKEIPLELEVGFDPPVSLAQLDEGRDMLNPVQVEMLQLDLVLMKESPEEGMR
jgi:hypothetical protein